MNRLLAVLQWRNVRWVACAAIVPALWACNARKLQAPVGGPSQVIQNRFQQSVNRDLDLLFMIDDSSSMAPLQAKMRAELPTFMNVLKGLPGGLPNLRVAVVSSSLGAGVFSNVPGCGNGTIGNLNGAFQHPAACTMLPADQNFLQSEGGVNNFTGDISDAFSCIANLGQSGCGFEHQFESTRFALQQAQATSGPNAGFLRPDAYLAIVMLTNEDDCSVPPDSTLFDPAQMSTMDPLGGLQSYRCNEFGHLCGGMAPPHLPPAAPMTLNNCVSAEDGKLVTVDGFVKFLRTLKANPDQQILVAAIAGPVTPYTVDSKPFQLQTGGTENEPFMQHSCMQAAGEYADPGVRIKQWLDAFGTNAVLESICANTFAASMTKIAETIGKALGVQCVTGNVLMKPDGMTPDCDVTQRKTSATKVNVDTPVPFCGNGGALAAAGTDTPCWQLDPPSNAGQCANARLLKVCYEPACVGNKPTTTTNALVACAVMP